VQSKPWEDLAIGKETYFVVETLLDKIAPDPIPLEEITGCFIRLFRRPPRDHELIDARDCFRNSGILVVGADERLGSFRL
jgi:hypothetical protein